MGTTSKERLRYSVWSIALNSFAAFWTFSTVFADAEAPFVNTLLTADWLTPASFATSWDVIFAGHGHLQIRLFLWSIF